MCKISIGAIECSDEGLRHPGTLRAADPRRHQLQSELAGLHHQVTDQAGVNALDRTAAKGFAGLLFKVTGNGREPTHHAAAAFPSLPHRKSQVTQPTRSSAPKTTGITALGHLD